MRAVARAIAVVGKIAAGGRRRRAHRAECDCGTERTWPGCWHAFLWRVRRSMRLRRRGPGGRAERSKASLLPGNCAERSVKWSVIFSPRDQRPPKSRPSDGGAYVVVTVFTSVPQICTPCITAEVIAGHA